MIGLVVTQMVRNDGCDRLRDKCAIKAAAILQGRREIVQDFSGNGRGHFIARHANAVRPRRQMQSERFKARLDRSGERFWAAEEQGDAARREFNVRDDLRGACMSLEQHVSPPLISVRHQNPGVGFDGNIPVKR